jgi:hypothetical protein
VTPSTTAQNLVLWGAAFMGAVILSALSAIATHWPAGGPIDWRAVVLDVIQTILSTAPLLAAGLGLPRLGHEPVAALVSQVGTTQAQAALEVEAVKQATGITAEPLTAEQRRLIVADLKAEMTRDPEGDDPLIARPPRWLPPDPHDPVTGTPPLPPAHEARG